MGSWKRLAIQAGIAGFVGMADVSAPALFNEVDARRIASVTRFVERLPSFIGGLDDKDRLIQSDSIFWGKPTSAFSSGTSITLDPCDVHGTDNGSANVAVYLLPDQSSYDISSWSIGTGSQTTGCTLPTSAIVAYVYGADGNAYVLGYPQVQVVDVRYYESTHYFQATIQFTIGLAQSTVSDWLNVRECTATTVLTDVSLSAGGGLEFTRAVLYSPEVDTETDKPIDVEESEVTPCSESPP